MTAPASPPSATSPATIRIHVVRVVGPLVRIQRIGWDTPEGLPDVTWVSQVDVQILQIGGDQLGYVQSVGEGENVHSLDGLPVMAGKFPVGPAPRERIQTVQ